MLANFVTDLAVERDQLIDNLLVRIHFIIEVTWWTGLAPWDSEFVFLGSLISTFLDLAEVQSHPPLAPKGGDDLGVR